MRRKKILLVASKLMSQKGYRGASLQEIADHVGIHKSTLFHYFKNKEELLLEVLKTSIDEVTENLKVIINNEDLSPEEKFKQAIDNHLVLLAKYIDNVNVYHSDIIGLLSRKGKQKYIETRKRYESCFEQIINNIQEHNTGYFDGMDSKIVTFGILGMCNWVAKWFKKSGRYKIEDISDIFFRMITQRNR